MASSALFLGLAPQGVAAFHPAEDEALGCPQNDHLAAPNFDPLSFLTSLSSSSPTPFSSAPSSSPAPPSSEPPMLVPSLGDPHHPAPFLLDGEDDAVANFDDLTYADMLGAGDFLSLVPHPPPCAEKGEGVAAVKPESLFFPDPDTSRFLDDCLTEELREPPLASPSSSSVSLAPSPVMSAFPSRAGSPSPSGTPSPPALSSPCPLMYFEGQLGQLPSRKRPRAPRGQAEPSSIPALPPRKRKVGEVMPEEEKKERNKVAAQKYRQKLRASAEETEVTCRRLQMENTELACQIRVERENIDRLKQTLVKYGVIPAASLSC